MVPPIAAPRYFLPPQLSGMVLKLPLTVIVPLSLTASMTTSLKGMPVSWAPAR